MKIAGKEIGFKRTVLANCRLTEIAPDRNIARFFQEKISSTDYAEAQMAAAQFISVLNEGYEQAKRFEDLGYTPAPIPADALLSLTDEEFSELYNEALRVYMSDGKTTVEVEAPKGKKTAKPRR